MHAIQALCLSCRLLALVGILVLQGCATAPQSRQLLKAPVTELPALVELAHVPFFPQDDLYCGPAALSTLLVERGLAVTPEQLVPEVYVPRRQGSLQAELLAATRVRGLLAYPLAPELQTMLREVAAGHPVLVLQNLGLAWAPRWHYAVVVGYDLSRGEILLRSGPHARHVNSLARFERTWRRAGHWAMVVTEPGRMPATAQPRPWLQAAYDLESTGQPAAAAAAYEAATGRWPEQAVGWFGLGNSYHALGEHARAEAALRELLIRQPRLSMAWNNLAQVMVARGCGEQARAAAECALRLVPEDPRYRSTLEQAQGMAESNACESVECPDSHGVRLE